MKQKAFDLMRNAERSWWYRGRVAAVRAALARSGIGRVDSILDFGAGYGGVYDELARHSTEVYAFEPNADARAIAGMRGYATVYATETAALARRYDAIALFDVLEHVENDRALLNSLHHSLNPGGLLVLTVPAFPFLWSEHDVQHMHFRRYRRKSLEYLLQTIGYEVLLVSHWDIFAFIPAAFMRMVGETGAGALTPPPFLDRIFTLVTAVEAVLIRFISAPFGVSLVAVARKREEEVLDSKKRGFLSITADDFGLTRLVTDRILETADRGALTAVSLIANGEGTEYALEAYLKRRERLKLSVHCNLTEGPALSPKEQVPHLVDKKGNLRHSFLSLLLRSLFAVSSTRRQLKSEIKKELSAQIALVRDAIGEGELRIDGHQHVHMLPFAFDVLCEIAPAYGVSSVRIPKEPFYFATPLRFSNIAKHFLLNALARGNRKKARAAGLAANDRFLGALYSGVMSLASFERGLSCIRAHTPNASVEALFHPGNPNVLDTPRAQYPRSDLWYASTYRLQEYQALMDPRFKAIVHQFEQRKREQAPHTWRDFWNGEHRIYVSEKHKRVHYDAIARDVLSLLPAGTHTILDYGCGDALSTETFVSAGLTVVLCDPIPAVTQSLHKRFDGVSGVRIVGDLEELSPASVDVILINSVLQYLSKEEFLALLPVCKKVLRPGGALLIGDVVPKGSHLFADVRSLLVSAYRYQFLAAAFWGLFETFFSGYRALRRAQGFSTYSDTEFIALLREAHFSGKRAERNIGLTPHRMTFVAK